MSALTESWSTVSENRLIVDHITTDWTLIMSAQIESWSQTGSWSFQHRLKVDHVSTNWQLIMSAQADSRSCPHRVTVDHVGTDWQLIMSAQTQRWLCEHNNPKNPCTHSRTAKCKCSMPFPALAQPRNFSKCNGTLSNPFLHRSFSKWRRMWTSITHFCVVLSATEDGCGPL